MIKEYAADLRIMGIRKGEGGIRSVKYKSCFSPGVDCDDYRPLFWITNAVKRVYEETYGVTPSRCYTEYGLSRTGCVGCPFNSDFENELRVIEHFEPRLYDAVNNVFGKSHEYARRFRSFQYEKSMLSKNN